jgi:hypothetical protein
MKLRYETGLAAMMQLLVVTVLSFFAELYNMVSDCSEATSSFNCVTDVGIDLIYVILVAAWFGFVSALAYAAQDKRDRRLAYMLIAAEVMVLVVALFFNARRYSNLVGLLTSLVDSAFAIWIIYLAFNLARAKGGRITSRSAAAGRPRRRPSVSSQTKAAKD